MRPPVAAVRVATLLLVATVLFAGCAGIAPGPSTDSPPSSTTSRTPTPTTAAPEPRTTASFDLDAARRRALSAETQRVRAVLENASAGSPNVSEATIGAVADPTTTVLALSGDGVTVRTSVPYGYGYVCGDGAGHVDGQRAIAVYRVTAAAAELQRVEEPVTFRC